MPPTTEAASVVLPEPGMPEMAMRRRCDSSRDWKRSGQSKLVEAGRKGDEYSKLSGRGIRLACPLWAPLSLTSS